MLKEEMRLRVTSNTSFEMVDLDGGQKTETKDSGAQAKEVVSEQDEEEPEELKPISWTNIIFLPFFGWWRNIIMFTVCVKCVYGPLSAIYPSMHCEHELNKDVFLDYIQFYYIYFSDIIYAIDTVLYIIHRQVTDEAIKRKELPKSGCYIILDIIALVPFFSLLSTEDVCSSKVILWPNILYFIEMVTIYRVVDYFSLDICHSFWKLGIGYAIMSLLTINAIACFLLVLTHTGLCTACAEGHFDWRRFQYLKTKQDTNQVHLYFRAAIYVNSILEHYLIDDTIPSTYLEYVLFNGTSELGFLFFTFVLLPRIFEECVLRYKRLFSFQPRVKRVLQEIQTRNPIYYKNVENFYSLMWTKQGGITSIPKMIHRLPRNLRVDTRLDLAWTVFYHSPTFRKTSFVFKRWLSEFVFLQYKLPGERFFTGMHSFSNLCYIKTGIVQLLSADDNVAPTLSVTSGTLFGDISFYTPPIGRQVYARCHTYCEIFSISRDKILQALHKFPEDRQHVMNLVRYRLKHARDLYACKINLKQDRNEKEGITWLKRRWWEISVLVRQWKMSGNEKSCKIPPEEEPFHCSKFIGQLVLCKELLLQKDSLFHRVEFPWILSPGSLLLQIWRTIVVATIILVLFLHPPNLARGGTSTAPAWFGHFSTTVDIIYLTDIFVTILTAKESKEYVQSNPMVTIIDRCKDKYFTLDVLSTPIVDYFFTIQQLKVYAKLGPFNRLIKTYVLLKNRYKTNWSGNHLTEFYMRSALITFCAFYIPAYLIFILTEIIDTVSVEYFFGDMCGVQSSQNSSASCLPTLEYSKYGILTVVFRWVTVRLFFIASNEITESNTLTDLMIGNALVTFYFVIFLYLKAKHVAALYMKDLDLVNYQYFSTKVLKSYKLWATRPDLMIRLNAYVNVHWQSYKGADVLHPNLLKKEPYDVYWKLYGRTKEHMIRESKAFSGANPALIRELSLKLNLLTIPKNGFFLAYGVFGENVNFLLRGSVAICQDQQNETEPQCFPTGQIIGLPTVFFGQPSLRTYYAASDCEILFMKIEDFITIIQHYPEEWEYLRTAIEEFAPMFDKLYRQSLTSQIKPGERVYQPQPSMTEQMQGKGGFLNRLKFIKEFKKDPESQFIWYWMTFRAFIVFVDLAAAALKGGHAAVISRTVAFVQYFCFMIAAIDIIVKLFLPYYDDRGLIITDIRKCALHYITRGFTVDVLSVASRWPRATSIVFGPEPKKIRKIVKTVATGASIYLLIGWFDYCANSPVNYASLITILKWQVVIILVMLTTGYFYTWECIALDWDNTGRLYSTKFQNETCWMPLYFEMDPKPTMEQLHFTYAQSLSLAQSAFFNFIGQNNLETKEMISTFIFVCLAIFFWYQKCICQAMLILHYRGDRLIRYGIGQLRDFLENERIDQNITDRALNHFNYLWKRTLKILDTLLKGGDSVLRQLAGQFEECYFLAGEDIVREMEMTDQVFVVERGKVAVTLQGKKLTTLYKGSIFGQLEGVQSRPISVTVTSLERADLLFMSSRTFQAEITNDVRENISASPNSERGFISIQKHPGENPYNTIEYIMRENKTIKLPLMTNPVSADDNAWYARWLLWAWLIGPVSLTAVVGLIVNKYDKSSGKIFYFVAFLDLMHFLYLVTECYTMRLVVVGMKCEYRYYGWKKLTHWWLYIDVLSLILPLMAVVMQTWEFHLTRILRIYTVILFYRHFCSDINDRRLLLTVLKLVLVLLLMHTLTCIWMTLNCQYKLNLSEFPVKNYPVPATYSKVIDRHEWIQPDERKAGCPISTAANNITGLSKKTKSFLVPRDSRADYLISYTFIAVLQTHINFDGILPLTLKDVYFKIVAQHILYVVELWLSSIAISAVHAKYHKLYHYDFRVSNLIQYLKTNGVSQFLTNAVKVYTRTLWLRHRGSQLPEITDQMPVCLREDIFGALYMYHLQTPLLFQGIPAYFLRQVVVRLRRNMIFPGKLIVQEGDQHSCLYFIHEGEVEKWYTDSQGENRLAAVLGTNGYFGIMPALYPDIRYTFTYYSRTIVDIVSLHFRDWQDLLEGYPEIKNKIYSRVSNLKQKYAHKKV